MGSDKILYIYLGIECNENCVFCVAYENSGISRFGSLTTREAKSTIRKFVKSGGTVINFTGGEPTLRNDLPEIIRSAEELSGLKSICIITNGVRLTDKKYLNKLIKADKKHKLSFSFSLHSHKKSISELLTNSQNTFEKTISGITNVIETQRNVAIYHIITSKNYKDLLPFCCFLKETFPEIKWIVFAYPFPQGRALLNDWIYVNINSLKPYFIKALKFLELNHYDVKIASCGQLPLCALPGFEEKVIDPRFFIQDHTVGMMGKKDFQKFEYNTDEWVSSNKGQNANCCKCVFNTICQGLWKKYVDIFGYEGINPITIENFQGNKILIFLDSQDGLEFLKSKLNKKKLNLVKLSHYDDNILKGAIEYMQMNQILSVIIDRKNQILYP